MSDDILSDELIAEIDGLIPNAGGGHWLADGKSLVDELGARLGEFLTEQDAKLAEDIHAALPRLVASHRALAKAVTYLTHHTVHNH